MRDKNQMNNETVGKALSDIGDVSSNPDTMDRYNNDGFFTAMGSAIMAGGIAMSIVAALPVTPVGVVLDIAGLISAVALGFAAGVPLLDSALKFSPKQRRARHALHDAAKAGNLLVSEADMDELFGKLSPLKPGDDEDQVFVVQDTHDPKAKAAFYPFQLGGQKEAQRLEAEARRGAPAAVPA